MPMICRAPPPMILRLVFVLLCSVLWPGAVAAQAPAANDGRQRLALVVGIGTVGGREVLPSAQRDAPAVAAALSAGGYEVLLRQNTNSADLRAAFKQFRAQLKPDGLGLVYLTGPMAQVDGRNLLVPADAALNEAAEAQAAAALLRVVGVPVQEALDALAGSADAPRVLVLDGAYRIAPLSRMTPPGLTRQRTPEGTMVMLGHVPSAVQDAPVAEPAPADAKDPKSRAATRLAKAMADALTLSGITVAEALRAVRLEVLDASGGRTQPAILGALATRVIFAVKPNAPALAAAPAAAAASAVAGAALPARVPAPGPVAVVPSAAPAVLPSALPAVVAVPVPVPVPVPAAGTAVSAATAPAATPAPPAPASAAASAPAAVAVAPAASAASPALKPVDGRTERAPGQGERPVYQTRANSYGHAEGDVLSYERVDTRKDEVLASYVIAIEKIVDNGALQANGGLWQLDPEGRPVGVKSEDGAETRFEPAEAWWWARPRAGEARAVQFVENYLRADKSKGRISWRGQAQVGSARVMEVQAGEFEVLPIRITGQGTDTPEGKPPVQMTFTRVVHFAPKLGVPVAIDIEDNDAGGRPLKRERIELTHAQQARTNNN
jgi:hypothetical protein